LKSPFLDGESILSATEDDRALPSSSALETPFLQELTLSTDRASAPTDEAESYAGEVQFEELEPLQDEQAWDLESDAVPEFADEDSEAEDNDEVDETYEPWSETGADSDETEDSFEADHVPQLEPLELAAELAPDEELFLGAGVQTPVEHLGEESERSRGWELARLGEVSGDSADTTVSYDQALIDPDYNAVAGDEPSEIWAYAQRLREIIERRGEPFNPDRELLANAVLLQLQTLGLYREIKLAMRAVKQSGRTQPLHLYVLLFPGEGRDNTGIKELNDKVLGYKVTSGFIKKRQSAIAKLFWNVETVGPRYVTVGQDYKTASIVAYDMTRQTFADDLIKLNAQLRQHLLDSLDEAEKDPHDSKQLAEIRKLRKVLQKNKKYQFDFLFGTFSFDLSQQRSEIEALFLLLTQALKGAGIARFVSKASSQKSREARKIAVGTGVKQDAKKLDTRGKTFDLNAYRKTTNAADQIKTFMSTPYNRDRPYDYINILVDRVWDWAFLKYRKLWSGNPDVIRDVRKKLLVSPTVK
jgi:hypothetical protein